MTALAEIIKNQSVRIDNHDSGTGRPFEWGTGVHIHKITNKKPYNGLELVIPLDQSGKIRFLKEKKCRTQDQDKLKSEIRKAFKEKNTRLNFAKSLNEALQTLVRDKDKNSDIEQILRESANNIIKLFGLTYNESDFWFTNRDNFISMYKDVETDKLAFIQQNFVRQDITIAENREDLELFDSADIE